MCVLSILLNIYFLVRAYVKNRKRARNTLSRGLSSFRRGNGNNGFELSPDPEVNRNGEEVNNQNEGNTRQETINVETNDSQVVQ